LLAASSVSVAFVDERLEILHELVIVIETSSVGAVDYV
jgi:hypothetical protein